MNSLPALHHGLMYPPNACGTQPASVHLCRDWRRATRARATAPPGAGAHAQRDARAVKLVHLVALRRAAAGWREHQLQLAGRLDQQVGRAVLVPKRVPARPRAAP